MLDLGWDFCVWGVLFGGLADFFVSGVGIRSCRLTWLCKMGLMWMESWSFEGVGFVRSSIFGMFVESVVVWGTVFFFPADPFSFHEEFLFNFKSKMFIVSNLTILLNQNLLFPSNKNHSLLTSKLGSPCRLSPARSPCSSSGLASSPSSLPSPSSTSPPPHPLMTTPPSGWKLAVACLVILRPYCIAFLSGFPFWAFFAFECLPWCRRRIFAWRKPRVLRLSCWIIWWWFTKF